MKHFQKKKTLQIATKVCNHEQITNAISKPEVDTPLNIKFIN